MDLAKDNLWKIFLKYLIPVMSAALFTSFYYVADTVMIGHGIGGDGLVALNIMIPVFSPLYGIGYFFGIGGSVLFGISMGQNNKKRADSIYSTSLCLLVITGVLLTIVLFLFRYPIVRFLGADDSNIELVMQYAIWVLGFAWVFIFFPFFMTFIRNDKDPNRSMAGSITGSLLNVIFDYVFIYVIKIGIGGAVIATIIGAIANILICSSHFLLKDNNLVFAFSKVDFSESVAIFRAGITSFVSECANGFVILIFNWQILKYIGNTGLIIYSVISNTVLVTVALSTGIATAIQPIVSYNYGIGLYDRIDRCKKNALKVSIIMNVILYVFIWIYRIELIWLYVEPSKEVLMMGKDAISLYFLCIFPQLFNILYTMYFQSINKGGISFVISLLRGMLLSSAMVMLLPLMFGNTGIWCATFVSEVITMIITIVLSYKSKLIKNE